MPAQTVIKLRRDTAANWTSVNPVLSAGEPGYETDTKKLKFGDGTTAWTALPYTESEVTDVEFIQFITDANHTAGIGELAWNADQETLDLGLDENVTLQLGQELLVRVKNASAVGPIPKGTLVMFAGAAGDTVSVAPAVTDGSVPHEYILGIATEDIDAEDFGFVTQYGFVNGVDTSAYAVGTILYADPAVPGGLTATKPAAPNLKLPIAAVTFSNAAAGRMLVRMKTGFTLDELHNVSLNGTNAGEFLKYDGTKWVNAVIDLSPKANVLNPEFNIIGTLEHQFAQSATMYGSPTSLFFEASGQIENISLTAGSEVYFSGTTYSGNNIDNILFTITDASMSGSFSQLTLATVSSDDNAQVQSYLNALNFTPVSGVVIKQDFDKVISAIELGQLDGASSNIQAQLDALVPDTLNPATGSSFTQGSWLAVNPSTGSPQWQEGSVINASGIQATNGQLFQGGTVYYPLELTGHEGDSLGRASVLIIGKGDDSIGPYFVQKWENNNPQTLASIKSDGSFTAISAQVETAPTSSTVVRNITLSTSDPSGGSDGEVWLKYTN